MDRAPLAVADAAEKGEYRLFLVVIVELTGPSIGSSLEPPDIELPTTIGLPPLLFVKRSASLAFVLVPNLAVAVANVSLQDRQHRQLVFLTDAVGDDRGEVDGGVGDTGGKHGREPLEIADERIHFLFVEGVLGHHQVKLPVVGILAEADRSCQRFVVVGGTELSLFQGLRKPLSGLITHLGADQGAAQPAPVGRQGDHRALERSEPAPQVTAGAGEHAAVHRDVALDGGPHGLAVGLDALVVHPPTGAVGRHQLSGISRVVGPSRCRGEGRHRHQQDREPDLRPTAMSAHESLSRIFSSSAMRSAVETSPPIFTH